MARQHRFWAPDTRVHHFLAFFVLALVAGCASNDSAEQQPAKVEISIIAAADSNPDPTGRPSPIAVTIFEVEDEAEFLAMSRDDALTGREVGKKVRNARKINIRPGETVNLEHMMQPGTTHVGAVGAFRSIDDARWRSSARVERPRSFWGQPNLGFQVRVTASSIEVRNANDGSADSRGATSDDQ